MPEMTVIRLFSKLYPGPQVRAAASGSFLLCRLWWKPMRCHCWWMTRARIHLLALSRPIGRRHKLVSF